MLVTMETERSSIQWRLGTKVLSHLLASNYTVHLHYKKFELDATTRKHLLTLAERASYGCEPFVLL